MKMNKLINKIIPNSILQRKGLQKVLFNINWLTFEKIFHMVLRLFVGVWVARYLGPENYGIMNYAFAFVILFATFATLGLDNIVIRNLVKDSSNKKEILGTTLFLKFLGGCVLFILAVGASWFLNFDNIEVQIFVAIIAFAYIFKSFDTIDFWFQSQVKSKYSALARSIGFLFSSSLKVIMILLKAPLIAFISVFFIELLFIGVSLLIFYKWKTKDSIFNWKVKKNMMKSLLKDSWPLILSGLAVIIYMKIDQVMIGQMLGNTELGIYSAAVKISEAWYFIPVVISGSVFPAIINAKKRSHELYMNRLQILYDFFTWFSISVAFVVTLLSPFIINTLYGKEYSLAAGVLSIHIWAGVFIFMNVATMKYLIAENLTKIAFYRNLIGGIFNICLNLIMIPIFGIIGSAYATLISYCISILSTFCFKKSRSQFALLIKSLNILRVIKLIIKKTFIKY